MDEDAYAHLRSLATVIEVNYGRKREVAGPRLTLGMSHAGVPCDRQLRFRLDNHPPINHSDPLRALVGTGTHTVLEGIFSPLAPRFIAETAVHYGPLVGIVDLYDRVERAVVDWKTVTLDKLKSLRRTGPTVQHVIQTQLYGAGMQERGERPLWVSLVYLPTDGKLADAYLWRMPFDIGAADAAVDRVHGLLTAKDAPKTPGPQCRYCPFYVPNGPNGPGICNGDTGVSES